jgi:hypothetical protein
LQWQQSPLWQDGLRMGAPRESMRCCCRLFLAGLLLLLLWVGLNLHHRSAAAAL